MQRSANGYGQEWKRRLSSDEVKRAVCVDFEGRINEQPIILGVLTPDMDFTQYVLDPLFGSASDAKQKGSCPRCFCVRATIEDAIAATLDAARRSGGPIVGYSIHELDVVAEFARGRLPLWAGSYRDGKRTAKHWASLRHPEYVFQPRRGSGRYSLDQFLELCGYTVPRIHGRGNVGDRLAYVRHQLQTRTTYSDLTRAAKTKWSNVIAHNYHDVHGLRALMMTASREVDDGRDSAPVAP